MQRLEQLWKVVALAGQVRDLAIENKRYQFTLTEPATFYVHVEYASVQIGYHDRSEILIDAQVQAGFGWRVQTEQDAAGVYLVGQRRALVGGISRARFQVLLPPTTYIVLRLEHASYTVNDITQEVHLPATSPTDK